VATIREVTHERRAGVEERGTEDQPRRAGADDERLPPVSADPDALPPRLPPVYAPLPPESDD
jgi:hypothetical protein